MIGGRLGPIEDLSLQITREVSEDGTEVVTMQAALSEIAPQPCLYEDAPCMRINLATELSRVDLIRRFSILTAPGAIGGFSAVLVGLLTIVVTVLKILNIAGRRVAVKSKALIVGLLVEDNDDETLDKAAEELVARDAELKRIKSEKKEAGETGGKSGASDIKSPLDPTRGAGGAAGEV